MSMLSAGDNTPPDAGTPITTGRRTTITWVIQYLAMLLVITAWVSMVWVHPRLRRHNDGHTWRPAVQQVYNTLREVGYYVPAKILGKDSWRQFDWREARWSWSLWGSMVMCAAIPLLVSLALRRRLRDVGLGNPPLWGWRIVLIAVLLATPFLYWMATSDNFAAQAKMLYVVNPRGNVDLWNMSAPLIGAVLAEHLFVQGFVLAALLPGGRFPEHIPNAPVIGPWWQRMLRHIGLAQDTDSAKGMSKALVWLGLDGPAVWAILGSGLVFGYIHLGKHPVELLLSFPGGVGIAYVAYRTRSAWPALVVHLATMSITAAFMWPQWNLYGQYR